MNLERLNRQVITFCAIALLFAGSLYYLVSVAFENKEVLTERKDARLDIEDYLRDQAEAPVSEAD